MQLAVEQRGQLIGENDIWIAGFALHFDETLVTRDTDFQKVIAAGLPLRVMSF